MSKISQLITSKYDAHGNVVHCYKGVEFFEFIVGTIANPISVFVIKETERPFKQLWKAIQHIDNLKVA